MVLNLLVASDLNYLPHAVVALTSACVSNPHHRCRIFYMHAGLGEDDIAGVQAHFENYAATVAFLRVDDAKLGRFRTLTHTTTPTYHRLLCGDVLPPEVDRILYLDCDVIVRAALDGIYAMDLGPCTVAAVRDAFLNLVPWRTRLREITGMEVPDYFNSGVMLIDVARYRDTGVGPATLDLLERFHGELRFADQDALNLALAGLWQELPPKWNVQSHWYTQDYFSRSAGFPPAHHAQVVAAVKNPSIIHYTSPSKPWDSRNVHPLKQEYLKVRQLTPYATP